MYITPKEFAKQTNLPLEQIRKMCKNRRIPSIKIGPSYHINKEKAEKLLEEWETNPPEEPINAIATNEKKKKTASKRNTKKITEKCLEKLLQST